MFSKSNTISGLVAIVEEMKADKEQRQAKMKANHQKTITLSKNGWWPGCICFRLRVRRNNSTLLGPQ
jgi:hypothetical protein